MQDPVSLCVCHSEEYLILGFIFGSATCVSIVEGVKWFLRENPVSEDEDSESDGMESLQEKIENPGVLDQVREVVTPADQELFEMFEDEQNDPTKTKEQHQLRREIEKPEVELLVPAFGTRYASTQALHQRNQEHSEKSRTVVLSRREELDILDRYRSNEGSKFNRVDHLLGKEYKLHAIYINDMPKSTLLGYSNKVIGVRVKDPNYDALSGEFSSEAVITDLIDVGGQDRYNRGQVLSHRNKKE